MKQERCPEISPFLICAITKKYIFEFCFKLNGIAFLDNHQEVLSRMGFRKVNRQSELTEYDSFNGKVWRVWPECGNKFSKIDKKGDVT